MAEHIITCSQLFFYGWWSWQFLIILFISTFLDFVYGLSVASSNKKKAKFFLWLSIINNLAFLGVFKYYNFFALQIQQGVKMFGMHADPVLLNVVLPVGISFYTFHGMSYVFDIYNGRQKPKTNFIEYALFVSFFPILVAGPIERAGHLLPQVAQRRQFNYSQAADGCRLMLWGMFKKIIIADSMAVFISNSFSDYNHTSAFSLLLAAIAFSFQVYGDFSGYSDIALGTAKLFGFELLSNFRFPYFSRDISEFWRRWHISLSSWFRDYLYIPMGGSKAGKLKTIRNVFIIFLVSGFWHGANWTFIVWGFIHACCFLPLLLMNRNRRHTSDVVASERTLPTFTEIWQIVATFSVVTIAWIFFRSSSLRRAGGYMLRIVTDAIENPRQFLSLPPNAGLVIFCVLTLLLIDWWLRHDERKIRVSRYSIVNWFVYTIMSLLIFNAFLGYLIVKPGSFIYFQF